MGRKNQQQALLSGPPSELTLSQAIGRVEVINGNNIYTVTIPAMPTDESDPTLHMVELPPKFRNTMWIRRGGFVLVDRGAFEGRENKLSGEIMTVIHDEKSWRKMAYWPAEFCKAATEATKVQHLKHDEDDSSEDELLGSGNLNRRRQQDSSDEDE